jgi:hypothetical protein
MSFRWSFSQWETYNACPAKWKFRYIMKLPSSPPGPAAARGIELHDRVEEVILGRLPDTELTNPTTTKRFGGRPPARVDPTYVEVVQAFKNHPNGDRQTELKITLDKDWYLSGGNLAWCVSVLDASRCEDSVLHIGEWKSGTPKDTHADQRKLYALVGLRRWLGVQEVRVTTYYLEHKDVPAQRLVVKPTAEQKLRDLWEQRIEVMTKDQVHAPRPNEGCRWCDYSKAKGGPCQFGA